MKGLVIGKFYPPHRGHKYLIQVAQEYAEEVTLAVCSHPEQTIPAKERAEWLKEIHPEARVVLLDTSLFDTNDPYAWAEHTLHALGHVPDYMFTSEAYGDEYARLLGAEHILVDKERLVVPISARLIRENPEQYQEYLEPCVREYFARQ